MASKHLLPGYGNAYLSETITSLTASTAGADTIDCSRCGMLAVQLGSGQGSGSIQMQQAFAFHPATNLPIWGNFGSSITIQSSGPITLFDITDGPFGLMRFQSTLTAGTASVSIVGFPIPNSW